MALSDVTRLARIDEQLLELEYLYTRELMREKELNKTTLLVSNGFKYRIENLRRARQKLKQAMVQAPTKRMSYARTLADKKNKLLEAEAELQYIEAKYIEVMAKLMLDKNANDAEEALDLASDIKVQKRRVLKYENAVTRFIEHGSLLQERKVHTREALNHNPERDAKEILKDASLNQATEYPLWNLKTTPAKAENSATVALVTPPADYKPLSEAEVREIRKKVVIDFDE